MQISPLDRKTRNEILALYHRSLQGFHDANGSGDADRARLCLDDSRRLRRQYFARLPRVTMNCCPFDGKPLIRTFDPYGLDGLWWQSPTGAEEVSVGPYFCVLRGAVNLRSEKPTAGEAEIHPGPEVPYVIPRLLDRPGMVMVIGELEVAGGFTAYPLAYFAERRPPARDLAAQWCLTEYVYKTTLGEECWKTVEDPWDFDLLPWLEAGKVRWCLPGSGNSVLSDEPPERCPYLNLEGRRLPLCISKDGISEEALPDGIPQSPFED